jgi:hypothetical protein
VEAGVDVLRRCLRFGLLEAWELGGGREDVRFVHRLMNCVPSLKNSLGTSASSCSVSDMVDLVVESCG